MLGKEKRLIKSFPVFMSTSFMCIARGMQ